MCIQRFPKVWPLPILLLRVAKYGRARRNPSRRPYTPKRESASKKGTVIANPANPMITPSAAKATARLQRAATVRSGGRAAPIESGSPVRGRAKILKTSFLQLKSALQFREILAEGVFQSKRNVGRDASLMSLWGTQTH